MIESQRMKLLEILSDLNTTLSEISNEMRLSHTDEDWNLVSDKLRSSLKSAVLKISVFD